MGEMADYYNDIGMDTDEGGDDDWSNTRVDEYGSEVMDVIHQDQAMNSKVWTYYGDVSHHTEGKFLFFARDPRVLVKIVRAELLKGFHVGKISTKPNNGDYVLCLYDTNDKRKNELFQRYGDQANVKYRWWKSNADTLAGKYSEEFRQ